MAFVILILWLSFGRWPRRKIREWGWLKTQPESEESAAGTTEKPSLRVLDEIILPKEPGKVETRRGSEHRGRRHAVASWEAEIDCRVSWEMKQHAQCEPGRVIVPPDRTDYIPPERRARRSRSRMETEQQESR
ncbi:hypothetical protein E4T56_gene101 [Termitomyces sp. T112]|nr:hypothetical protein E4T56_gene101 [Termitomyces sp. T112]